MKFPSVYLTPRIAPASHASGRYDPVSNRIYISGEKFFEHDNETRIFVLLHELGHWLRENRVHKKQIMHGWELSSEGPEEDFADMFVLYVQNQKDCLEVYPYHHLAMTGFVGELSVNKIQKFAREALEKIVKKSECRNVRCLVWSPEQ